MTRERHVSIPHTEPLLVLAAFVCTESGREEFRRQVERALAEARSIDGCLHATVRSRPNRRYRLSTLWRDREAVTRWVENEFHRQVLMPGLREWCSEGWFEVFRLDVDPARAKRQASSRALAGRNADPARSELARATKDVGL